MGSFGENFFLNFLKLKNRFRAGAWPLFRVPTQKETLSSVLLCFPEKEANLKKYQVTVRQLVTLFPEARFAVVLHRSQLNTLTLPPETAVFVYDERDFSHFGVLKKSWQAALPAGLSLTIDLNTSDSLWSAYLCHSTAAPLRVTFEKERAGYFFNIILRSRTGASFSEKMEQLIQLIRALTETQQELAA